MPLCPWISVCVYVHACTVCMNSICKKLALAIYNAGFIKHLQMFKNECRAMRKNAIRFSKKKVRQVAGAWKQCCVIYIYIYLCLHLLVLSVAHFLPRINQRIMFGSRQDYGIISMTCHLPTRHSHLHCNQSLPFSFLALQSHNIVFLISTVMRINGIVWGE